MSTFEQFANPLELAIKEALENGTTDFKSGNSGWTKGLNGLLHDVCKRVHEGCYVASKHNVKKDTTEWLYDFVCFTENDFGLDDVLLVLESEWQHSFEQIKFDFEKLMLAKCNSKIMVFEASNSEAINQIIEQLTAVVKNSKLSVAGDRYVFIALDLVSEDFEFHYYQHA